MRTEKILNKNKSLIFLILAFALPIVLAKLSLENHWLEYGVTNKGNLQSEGKTISDLGISNESVNATWLIVMRTPENCRSICLEEITDLINNTYIALGRERLRVTPVFFSHVTHQDDVRSLLVDHWQVINADHIKQERTLTGDIFIVDPLKNLVLSYDAPINNEQLPMLGKSLLSDIKKLLKYSRIG